MPKSKKEISKEKMFSKIMPSVSNRPNVAPNVKAAQPFNPAAEQIKASQAAVAKQVEEEKTDEEIKVDEYVNKLSARKNEADPVKMADEIIAEPEKADNEKKKTVSTVMVNIRERMVENKLEDALEKFKCCKCFFCKQDVTTIALNNLKPKYVVTLEEDIDKIIECEDYEEVTQAIMKAILEVKTHPRH